MQHISVCVSTFQRPVLLDQLLSALARQNTGGKFSYSVVVADNDAEESARALVQRHAANFPTAIAYCVESRRSIALVRNKSLAEATGDLIAFIDDDEVPDPGWLLALFRTLMHQDCAGVLGPVRPYYPEDTPSWVRKGGFFERPEHETGHPMPWQECRTGNVLFHKSILRRDEPAFLPEFGTGGSDVDFFRRMMASGCKFVWCNEAPVYEIVPPSRWKRSTLLKRGLLRGANSFRMPDHRGRKVAKSLLALGCYTFALPFLQLAGHHYFMRYLVKLSDHAGLLLAGFHITPIRTRPM